MKTLNKDARGFIDGVAHYVALSKDGKTISPKVQAFFTNVTKQAKKEHVAAVASAVTLSSQEKSVIQKALTTFLGHTVECRWGVDTDMIGGIKIQVADWVMDSSLQTQLEDIARSIYSV